MQASQSILSGSLHRHKASRLEASSGSRKLGTNHGAGKEAGTRGGEFQNEVKFPTSTV